MPIPRQLMLPGKTFDRLSFPYRVVTVDIFYRFRLKDIKPAVDPTFFPMRFFFEVHNVVPVEYKPSKPRWRQHRSHRGNFPMRAMELDGGLNIDVGYAVPIGEQKGFVVL